MRYEEYVSKIIDDYMAQAKLETKDFPNLDLYIDQAAIFMNQNLAVYAKEEQEEILTKAMINNYTKHKMIPRPENKKYTKEHLIMLTLIFHLKGVFQINEIEMLMKPIVENYNSEFDEKYNMEKIYNIISRTQREENQNLREKVEADMQSIKKSMEDSDMLDDQLIEAFLLICDLIVKADASRFIAQKLLHEYFVKPAMESLEKPKKARKEKVMEAENRIRNRPERKRIYPKKTTKDLQIEDFLLNKAFDHRIEESDDDDIEVIIDPVTT